MTRKSKQVKKKKSEKMTKSGEIEDIDHLIDELIRVVNDGEDIPEEELYSYIEKENIDLSTIQKKGTQLQTIEKKVIKDALVKKKLIKPSIPLKKGKEKKKEKTHSLHLESLILGSLKNKMIFLKDMEKELMINFKVKSNDFQKVLEILTQKGYIEAGKWDSRRGGFVRVLPYLQEDTLYRITSKGKKVKLKP